MYTCRRRLTVGPADFSPYGQKTRLLLTAAGKPFQRCDQPPVLPRPTLETLGITYRRIPVLAIGKDVFCDTSIIVDAVQSLFGPLPQSPADKAYEAFGNTTFWSVLSLVPKAALTPEFIKDRETIFRQWLSQIPRTRVICADMLNGDGSNPQSSGFRKSASKCPWQIPS